MQDNSDQNSTKARNTDKKAEFLGLTLDLGSFINFMGLITAALIAGLFAVYNNPRNVFEPKYQLYQESNYGVRLQYPENWIKQDDRMSSFDPEVRFLAPKENSADRFQERVTVSIVNLSQPLSLKEYTERATAQIENHSTVIESAKQTTLANEEGRKIIYQESEGNKKRLAVWTVKDNKVYILTYTAETDKFDKFASKAKKTIQSVKIEP